MQATAAAIEPIDFIEQAAMNDAGVWALRHQLWLPSAGKPFSFEGHEYLEEPYSIRAPLLAFLKGAQLGFSERAVLCSLHDCNYRLKSGLAYYFPTKSDVSDFSKARFDPLIDSNPVLNSLVVSTDAANIKRVGPCTLYLRGLRSTVSAKTIPVDKVVFDEVDEANPEAVDLATKRLDHSEFQEKEFLSTPTIPDYGISAVWSLTDQRHRMLWCEACRSYTCLEIDFPDCLEPYDGGVRRVCKRCRAELNLAHERNEWVAMFPGRLVDGRPAVGYRISQLHSAYVSLEKILREYQESRFPQDFWNSRLAQAWIDAANRLEIEHVLAHCGTQGLEYRSEKERPCAIGIDVGPEKHHVVIRRPEASGAGKLIWMGEASWAGLDGIVERYHGRAVIDGLPESEKAVTWAKKQSHRAWACFYTASEKADPAWDDVAGKVTVNQVRTMDASHKRLQDGLEVLPQRSDLVVEFAKHCHNVARRRVENEETGAVHHEWIKLGADHYRKAFNFAVLASERLPGGRYKPPPDGYGRDRSYGRRRKGGLARSYRS